MTLLFLVVGTCRTHAFVMAPAISTTTYSSSRLFISSSTRDLLAWSKAGNQNSASSSRLGVRKRVKRVLDRAKSRTGLINRNSENSPSSTTTRAAMASSWTGFSSSTTSINESQLFPVSVFVEKPEDSFDESYGTFNKNPLNNDNDGKQQQQTSLGETSESNKISSTSSRSNSPTVAEPLPFRLPELSDLQRQLLDAGERVQEQSNMGREGRGFVVLDVDAPDYVVWECLLDFAKYPENIGTVRDVQLFTSEHLESSYTTESPVLPGEYETRHYGKPSNTRANFVLSKFRLNIAAIHRYHPHPHGHYMDFSLDPACKNVVLQDAKGIWYTQTLENGKTRVWLLCELVVSRLLPSFIVDYTAKRAMPRASTWIRPTVAAKKRQLGLADV